MDLRAFYQKIREIEETIDEQYAVVVSQVTPDGGRAGVVSEVARFTAARLVAEQRARLATPEEAEVLRASLKDFAEQAVQEQTASRLQLTVIPESELRQLRERIHPQKG